LSDLDPLISAPQPNFRSRSSAGRYKSGLSFFWVINDGLNWEAIDRHIAAFTSAGVSALCIHPRSGLRIPYGSDEWFETIKAICDRCDRAGLDVWLYDEDPYPSGSAGGRITAEYPELRAHQIVRYAYQPTENDDRLFVFPVGRLLWCGVVGKDDQPIAGSDLTNRVGMIRRNWTVLDPWDSRYYYPETPTYSCPRAWTFGEEYAVRVPAIDSSATLVAFVAQAAPADPGAHHWHWLPDRLNPQSALRFLEWTHDRYQDCVGNYFGDRIRAIFTDEPSYSLAHPWTPGVFEDFLRKFGYDLKPRMESLFSDSTSTRSMQTRIDFRRWCNERFKQAWLDPVARWCDQHELDLVGHMSPEDDPIQQVNLIGDSLPLMRGLSFPGFDLIIPAVGDAQHPLLNVGVISAVSVQQQQDRPEVLTETLGCSGREMDERTMRRVLSWQTLMGVTLPVLHAAYLSMRDERAIDAPPDLGPDAAIWPEVLKLAKELMPIQELLRGAVQVAPVAVLWPIRSFQALNLDWQNDMSGMRRGLSGLLLELLERQVGVHIIDEQTLRDATIEGLAFTLGRARYEHILVPPSLVWAQPTFDALDRAAAAGIDVRYVGRLPRYVQDDAGVHDWEPVGGTKAIDAASAAERMPRLINLGVDSQGVRCTAWIKDGRRFSLLLDLLDRGRMWSVGRGAAALNAEHIHLHHV
jgi:hypothetical protein